MNTVDLYAWLKENRDAIISKRISNVYHLPNSKKIFLKIKTEEYKFIVLEPSRAIYLSKQPYDMPAEPDILALSFRKYIKDMKISDIVQVGFDRFVKISFENGVSLYVELLPRGEIVLVDRDEKILHATEYKEMRDRAIKRGLRYSLPKVFLKPPSYEECEIFQLLHSMKKASQKNLEFLTKCSKKPYRVQKIRVQKMCAWKLKIF